jgi:uncharacterized membrane protein YphA (DoxX/SURF4 family)
MTPTLPTWLPLIGRLLFVSYFLTMGASHLINFREHTEFIASKGVPLPKAATLLTIVTMVGGGVLVLLGWHRTIGYALLFGIILPAPFFLHHWWTVHEPLPRLSEFAHFVKDLSLAGAALLLICSS